MCYEGGVTLCNDLSGLIVFGQDTYSSCFLWDNTMWLLCTSTYAPIYDSWQPKARRRTKALAILARCRTASPPEWVHGP